MKPITRVVSDLVPDVSVHGIFLQLQNLKCCFLHLLLQRTGEHQRPETTQSTREDSLHTNISPPAGSEQWLWICPRLGGTASCQTSCPESPCCWGTESTWGQFCGGLMWREWTAHLLQASETRLCLRQSLTSWRTLTALLSNSIFCMAAETPRTGDTTRTRDRHKTSKHLDTLRRKPN